MVVCLCVWEERCKRNLSLILCLRVFRVVGGEDVGDPDPALDVEGLSASGEVWTKLVYDQKRVQVPERTRSYFTS